MLNQEIATKADQTMLNDPILMGILSSVGLINSVKHNNTAMNILSNVNSLVPNMSHMMQNQMVPNNMGPMGPMVNMNPNMSNMVPNMSNMGPNMASMAGVGLLGPAPNLPIIPNVQNMSQNDFQINFDPRNGGLLGAAPFQNFPDNPNFGPYNDEFYPDNNDGNFVAFNNNRNRNFRNDRIPNNRRGRSWNNRHNNNRNNRNNRNRSNRSYTPP